MKGIKTLIKLQKKELDERARKKAVLESQMVQLRTNINTLQDELMKEEKLLESMPEMGFAFSQYAEGNKLRQQQLEQSYAHIKRQVYQIEEEMQEFFGELKKYEIALEQKIKKQRQKEKRVEDKFLDDVAMNKYIRGEG